MLPDAPCRGIGRERTATTVQQSLAPAINLNMMMSPGGVITHAQRKLLTQALARQHPHGHQARTGNNQVNLVEATQQARAMTGGTNAGGEAHGAPKLAMQTTGICTTRCVM